MIGIATAVRTPRERWNAAYVSFALMVGAGVGLLAAGEQLAKIVPFVTMYATLACGADVLTAFLLFGQARANRRASLNVLAFAYASCAFTAAAQLTVFPNVFAPSGLFGATDQTAAWFWVWWHGGFPVLVTLYVLVDRAFERRETRVHVPAWLPALAVTLLACAVAALVPITIAAEPHLPHIMIAGSYRGLGTSGIAPAIVVALVIAIGTLASCTRLRYGLHVWLCVALAAMVLDVILTVLGGGRFTLGWYLARLENLVAACVVLVSLLGAIARMYEQIARAATIDGLTGVFNRRAFDERLVLVRAGSARTGTPFSVLMLDVDLFKSYNDRYGHVAGDACLRTVAGSCAEALARLDDFFARYGGEEFVIVLPATGEAGARIVAERVRASLAARVIPHGGTASGRVTISIGLYAHDSVRERGLSADEIVSRADAALYVAKRDGRDRVASYDADVAPRPAPLTPQSVAC